MNRNIAAASNPGNRRLILAAVALGLLGAMLVYLASSSKGGSSSSSAPAGEGVPIVVAKADIPARTKITAAMVEVRLVPPDAASALGFKDASQVVGQVTRFPIAANEQVLVQQDRQPAPAPRPRAGRFRTSSRRASARFAINASEVQNAGGLLLPGDYVDIIVIYDVEFAAARRRPRDRGELPGPDPPPERRGPGGLADRRRRGARKRRPAPTASARATARPSPTPAPPR